MALRHLDSFDHYDIANMTGKWNTVYKQRASYVQTISSGNGRNSTDALYMAGGGVTLGYVLARKTFDDQATWIVGFAIKPTFFPVAPYFFVLAALIDVGTYQVSLNVEPDGTLGVYRGDAGASGVQLGTTSSGLSTDTWAYVEWKTTIHGSTGITEVKINGESLLSLEDQNTQASGNGTANQVQLGGEIVTYVGGYWEDLYICDGSGSIRKDFLGDLRVQAILPDGAGNYSQFTPSAGANYQNVDDSPPDDDATYNESSAAAQKDSFTMGDLAGGLIAEILGVQTNLWMKKTDAGVLTASPFLRISSTDHTAASHSPSAESYADYMRIWEQNPDTAANFSVSDINALEPGYEHVT